MSQESSQAAHRVVAIVDNGSNPFELGVATELFGLRRPELDGQLRAPWYDFRLCAATPTVSMHAGFFSLSDVEPLDIVDDADTVLVPNRPDPEVSPSAPVSVSVSVSWLPVPESWLVLMLALMLMLVLSLPPARSM